MKKSLIAASIALGLATSGTSWAGGIQIDPTGGGSVGGSSFVVDPGNSFGNALAQGVFPQPSAVPTAGTMYIQNAIDISSQVGVAGGELTFVMSIPVLASHAAVGGAPGIINYDTFGGSGVGTFDLYYNDSVIGGTAANKAAGTGFTDDVWLASGSVVLTPGTSWLYTSAIPGMVDLAGPGNPPSGIMTIQGGGSTGFDIDFTDGVKNDLYIVNDLTGLSIDMDMSNTLATPFTGAGVPTTSFAEAGAAPIFYGFDGDNDYTCALGFACDMQMMANTTLNFRAKEVPEPTTLALLGASLGLLGGISARRRRKST